MKAQEIIKAKLDKRVITLKYYDLKRRELRDFLHNPVDAQDTLTFLRLTSDLASRLEQLRVIDAEIETLELYLTD